MNNNIGWHKQKKQLPTRCDFVYMLMSLKSLKSLFKLKHFHYATKSCENENKQNVKIVSRSVKKNGTSKHPSLQITMALDLFEEFRLIRSLVKSFPSGVDLIMREIFENFIFAHAWFPSNVCWIPSRNL